MIIFFLQQHQKERIKKKERILGEKLANSQNVKEIKIMRTNLIRCFGYNVSSKKPGEIELFTIVKISPLPEVNDF